MKHVFGFLAVVFAFVLFVHPTAYATHSWGGYHWARQSNPFTLKAGDNLTANWKPFLTTTLSDWSQSSVLDMVKVAGQSKGNCRGTSGQDEICNKAYGNNGWLGVAQIWVSGLHITQGTVKVNDTYFNTSTYNTPAWRNLVMCQEVGHTLGLDHQDETFNNTNLGTCMDYTNDPDGKLYNQLDNEHPNQHDYDELGIIYAHLDSVTTVGQTISRLAQSYGDVASDNPGEWGRLVRQNGKLAVFEKDFGGENKLFTFVIFAE
jgi:hypothetical protein